MLAVFVCQKWWHSPLPISRLVQIPHMFESLVLTRATISTDRNWTHIVINGHRFLFSVRISFHLVSSYLIDPECVATRSCFMISFSKSVRGLLCTSFLSRSATRFYNNAFKVLVGGVTHFMLDHARRLYVKSIVIPIGSMYVLYMLL